MTAIRATVAVAVLSLVASVSAFEPATLVQSFTHLEWNWQSEAQREAYFASGAAACQPVGVRMDYMGNLYLTVPRFIKGVPATIARVQNNASGFPILHAYPSWADNALGVPGAMQSSLGFAIDDKHRMWVADNGKTADREPAQPQIVVIDMDMGVVTTRFALPEDVAPRATSFLNDITIDWRWETAYVSDSSDPVHGTAAGVIVYDHGHGTSHRALGAVPSTVPDDSVQVTINGVRLPPQPTGPRAGVDGIALTPDGQHVFYTPLTSHDIYVVRSDVLRASNVSTMPVPPGLIGKVQVMAGGSFAPALPGKDFSSDGIIFDNKGRLFLGSLDNSSLFVADLNVLDPGDHLHAPLMRANLTRVAGDAKQMQWPDTIAFDHKGSVVWLADGPAHFPPLDLGATNFRVWSVPVGADFYLRH